MTHRTYTFLIIILSNAKKIKIIDSRVDNYREIPTVNKIMINDTHTHSIQFLIKNIERKTHIRDLCNVILLLAYACG
jgi:hypothetical protein